MPNIVRVLLGLFFVATGSMASGATATVPPPPPSPYGPVLIVWSAEAVRCGDAQPKILRAPDPAPALGYGTPERPAVLTARFRIDPDGRPLGISRVETDFVPDSDDLLPALAAARFAPGIAQPACTVRFVASRQPLATAPIEQAWFYSVNLRGTPPGQLWERVWSGGGNCTNPAPAPLLNVWPDYKALAGQPGRREWAMITYNLDRNGRPVDAQVAAGTANPALDAASVRSIKGSRFEKGARRGCLMPFVRNADRLAPPEPPSEESLRPKDATCPRELLYVRQPTLTFPDAYQKRSIEGWAVMAYDVAPWGALGNIRVLQAEPSDDFGNWAKNVLASATKAPSSTGYVGCVDRVLFKIGPTAKLFVSTDPQTPD